MGCLDPQVDAARTFELLRARGACRAEVSFTGGHDEGGVEGIVLTLDSGEKVELEHWYCGGYRIGEHGAYVPVSTPANEDEELADLLSGPVDSVFGSWGDVPHTDGTLVWVTHSTTVTAELRYGQDTWQQFASMFDLGNSPDAATVKAHG